MLPSTGRDFVVSRNWPTKPNKGADEGAASIVASCNRPRKPKGDTEEGTGRLSIGRQEPLAGFFLLMCSACRDLVAESKAGTCNSYLLRKLRNLLGWPGEGP